jgi:hypothetical protein
MDSESALFTDERLERLVAGLIVVRQEEGVGTDVAPSFADAASIDVRGIVDGVLAEVQEFSRGAPRADDITALCVRYSGRV